MLSDSDIDAALESFGLNITGRTDPDDGNPPVVPAADIDILSGMQRIRHGLQIDAISARIERLGTNPLRAWA